MSRQQHFDDGRGNPIIGWNTEDSAICRNCAQDNVEYADVNIKTSIPIRSSNIGKGADMYPDGFTCDGCQEVLYE